MSSKCCEFSSLVALVVRGLGPGSSWVSVSLSADTGGLDDYSAVLLSSRYRNLWPDIVSAEVQKVLTFRKMGLEARCDGHACDPRTLGAEAGGLQL